MAENRANLKTVISADSTQFNSAMGRAVLRSQRAGMGIAKGVGRATVGIAKMGATAAVAAGSIGLIGGALAGAAMLKGLKSAADLGGKVSDLAAQTGIAAGNITVMQRALEDNGVAGDKVGSIINKLQKAIYEAQDGTGAASKAFADLGISISDLMRMTPDKQFEAIQRSIAKIQDPTKRAAMAMQIFGKSGGELLTLFADTGAFDNAAKFVGTQADILNRSAGIFDSISDKLARVPDKLRGFFVGFLEPMAGAVNGILDKFESYDFTKSGLKMGESFMRAVEMLRGAIDSLSIGEIFELAGLTLKVKLMEAGNELWKVASAISTMFNAGGALSDALESAALKFKEVMLGVVATMVEEIALIMPKGMIHEAKAENAVNYLRASADLAAAQKEAIDEKVSDTSFADQFKKARDAAKDIFKVPESDLYAIEDGFQKIRVAADKYSMDRINATEATAAAYAGGVAASTAATTPSLSSAFEQMGPSKSLANKGIFDAIAKRDASSKAGFGGLAGLYGMQVDRAGGGKVGANSAFNRDRERLGVGSGLVTGGLGEKRRLNTKQEKPQEPKEELGFLQSIDRNIKSALTVG